MQTNPSYQPISGLARWIETLIGLRLPEKVQDRAACVWMFSAVFWMIIGMSLGMIAAIKLVYPNFLGGVEVLTFGRMRPDHVNTIVFGWISGIEIGASLYIIPRLCRRHLYLGELAVIAGWVYNLILVLGNITVAMGFTKGAEYEEWILPLNIGVLLCVNTVVVCLVMTVLDRQNEKLYVSIWYFAFAYLTLDFIYVSANLRSYFGAEDAVINWFYGHNAVGSWMSGAGVAILYYIVPKQLNKKLFAHRIAIWGFWTFAAFYIWNGGHHLIYGPVPKVVPMMGIFFAIGMVFPFTATSISLGGTIWGEWQKIWQNLPLRFSVLGAFVYFFASLTGAIQAREDVNIVQHFTDYTIAHVHLAFLGFITPAANGLIYLMVEKSFKRKLIPFLTSAHFWLYFVGIGLYFIPIQIAGVLVGLGWLEQLPFSETVAIRAPYYYLRTYSGLFLVGAQSMFAWNIIAAMQSPPELEIELIEAGGGVPPSEIASSEAAAIERERSS
ncbi:MAG: cb-type cytochrome C oxidase subunit I [Gloeocapsa sp. DLM2.Bin57]|nr:MAG: cb-type cytochrome C oxidase subunit I [Gloeocapsa sp. DLM2.Bin57]